MGEGKWGKLSRLLICSNKKTNIMNSKKNNIMKTENNNAMNTNNKDMQTSDNAKNVLNKIDQVKESSELCDANQKHFEKQFNGDWGLIKQLSQRDMYKAVVESRKALFNATAEHREAFYKQVLDTRLQALKEQSRSALTMISSEYQTQVTAFVAEKIDEITTTIQTKRKSLFLKMREQYDFLEEMKDNEFLANLYKEEIQKESESVVQFLESLLQNFKVSVMEQVNRYR